MTEMFISWSGEHSKIIASNLKSILELAFENEDITVFMSEKDIESGTEWFPSIKYHLNNSCCAIIVLTKENTNAPWVLFESGAMAMKYEDKRVIPFLFEVNIREDHPLYHYNRIKYSREGFNKMIFDIRSFCEFQNSTKKQLETILSSLYNEFNDNIKDSIHQLSISGFFGSAYIYPKSIRTVSKDSIFISSPMNSIKNDEEYKQLRSDILSLKTQLCELGFQEIIYPGTEIESNTQFEGENKAINKNFKKLKSAECLLAIYPKSIASSVLLEIGYAIALTKNIVVFTKHKKKLPFMLREADTINNIKIFEYKNFKDIEDRIIMNGRDLFNIE